MYNTLKICFEFVKIVGLLLTCPLFNKLLTKHCFVFVYRMWIPKMSLLIRIQEISLRTNNQTMANNFN